MLKLSNEMKTSCILILTAVIAIVTKEGTSRYLLVEVDNKETNGEFLLISTHNALLNKYVSRY